ncbi:MAG: hypothetical protein JWO84_642 [Parcubacteria group bacterium]|nr:hypothetical protein [Parcubacteria group bacterium]
MSSTATSITIVIALLALFLISITVAKYAMPHKFAQTRFTMSALFVFILLTLSISFWPWARLTLPYTIPAFILGMLLGYFIGVRTERQKLMTHGLEHYMERFAHIEHSDVRNLTWWSIINFYSITCALVLINLVGFTNIILSGYPPFIIVTSVVGAALIGSILPYLAHLWTIPFKKDA